MFKLLVQNIQNRLKGETARANAQLGLVSAPEGGGKLIWLVADHSYDSILLAVTLMAAIRQKRIDVRLVLTYQTEYKNLLITHLSGLKKIGFGYGCGESQLAANKMLTRLDPFAILFIGNEPHKTLISAVEKKMKKHLIAFQYQPVEPYLSTFYEACYPDNIDNGQDNTFNSQSCQFVSKPFSVMSRLVQSQIDTQLGAMLCGSESRALYHVHNLPDIDEMINCWKKSALSNDNLLIISYSHLDLTKLESIAVDIHKNALSTVFLSQWGQDSLTPNNIIIVDEQKWYAAVCVSAVTTHLFQTDKNHFWQAVSSGGTISRDKTFSQISDQLVPHIQCHQSLKELMESWLSLSEDATIQRAQSDAVRKVFWSERRLAEEQTNALLQRVFDW